MSGFHGTGGIVERRRQELPDLISDLDTAKGLGCHGQAVGNAAYCRIDMGVNINDFHKRTAPFCTESFE